MNTKNIFWKPNQNCLITHPLWIEGTPIVKSQILNKVAKEREDEAREKESPPAPIRITLASLEDYNILLQNGLDFYGATFFPTEANLELNGPVRIATKKGRYFIKYKLDCFAIGINLIKIKIDIFSRMVDGSIPGRVRELLPVFDATGFCKIPPPVSKTIKPRP